tara:strand:- start:10530 stop:10940 length:411 start_codon:yes stop_codon:yes gene_type:complete
MILSRKIINEMINKDAFSKWLGIEILEINEGRCKIQMKIRDEMTNGFGIAHGGISFSLADSCLAFASNSYGNKALSIETSISHTKKVRIGDVLVAESTEMNKTSKTGLYYITITNQNNKEIAHFKGTVYFSSEKWF